MKKRKLNKIKRLSEIIISVCLVIIFLPIILAALIISFIETGTNPIFIQLRGLSIDGKLFKLYKIRTVKPNANTNYITGRKFLLSPGYKEYVPKLSKIIRQFGIDELPQLFNVLKGEMSLIGPRPLDIFDLKYLKENFSIENDERKQLTSMPGILGLWQLFGKRSRGAEDLLYWDNYYEKEFSLLLDTKIIFETFSFYLRTRIKEDSIFGQEAARQI